MKVSVCAKDVYISIIHKYKKKKLDIEDLFDKLFAGIKRSHRIVFNKGKKSRYITKVFTLENNYLYIHIIYMLVYNKSLRAHITRG